ncbi:MAG: hypothetical protein PHT07_01135 [Paludibacter sp.]|nr:hypothetical protein [Paludibacter sp.]
MKYFIPILLILILLSCKNSSNKAPKIKYSGYYALAEDRRIYPMIDSVSSIQELIPKLKTNYTLYDTYKGYWIGYNDLMFSIAVHGDSAIQPLVNFIETTNSMNAKFAGLYTLHLIGIHCKEAGRDYEEFTNMNARKALLKLYRNVDLQVKIMQLLIRDPRESDIPQLFDILESSHTDCWTISSGLLRYYLPNKPFTRGIPENILHLKIHMKEYTNDYHDNKINQDILKKINRKYKKYIVVEDTLFNYQFSHRIASYDDNQIYLHELLSSCAYIDYCGEIGNNYQYYYKNNIIHFCSSATSKKLWLAWWKSQSSTYKNRLLNSDKRIKDKFIPEDL